jgi:hypothetical protein
MWAQVGGEMSRMKAVLHLATASPSPAAIDQQGAHLVQPRDAVPPVATPQLPRASDGGGGGYLNQIQQRVVPEVNGWLPQALQSVTLPLTLPPPPPCTTPSPERSARNATTGAEGIDASSLPEGWRKPRWRLLIFGNQRVESLARLCKSLQLATINETVAVNFYLEAGQPQEMCVCVRIRCQPEPLLVCTPALPSPASLTLPRQPRGCHRNRRSHLRLAPPRLTWLHSPNRRAHRYDFVRRFEWPYGPVQVMARHTKGGLINAIIEGWFPANDDEWAIFLEDDIEVSPAFLTCVTSRPLFSAMITAAVRAKIVLVGWGWVGGGGGSSWYHNCFVSGVQRDCVDYVLL